MFTAFGERSRRTRPKVQPRRQKAPAARKPGTITRKQMTPNQLAIFELGKALEAIPNTTPELRRQFQDEMIQMEQIRYMHMPTLAATLMFIHNVHDEITPENFTDENLQPVIINIQPDPKLQDSRLAYIKTKETILRYIRAVQFFRQQQQELLETQIAEVATQASTEAASTQ